MDIKLINKIVQIIKLSLDNNVDLDTLLNNIFSLLAEEYGLNINLRIEETCEECETRRGCVDKEKTIILYRKGIDNSILEESEEFSFLTDKDVEIFKIIYYIKTLIHELQHVKLKQDKKNNSQDIAVLIMKLCDNKTKSVSAVGYMGKFYELNPEERLVELYAFKSIVAILEKMGDEYKNLFKILKSKYLLEKIYNYYKYGLKGPTTQYLDFFSNFADPARKNELKTFKKKIKDKNLSVDERVYYGFEISEEEYVRIAKEYLSLQTELKSISNNKKSQNL